MGRDYLDYALDMEGRERDNFLAVGRMRSEGSLKWLSGEKWRWKGSGSHGERGKGRISSLSLFSPCGGLQLLNFSLFGVDLRIL